MASFITTEEFENAINNKPALQWKELPLNIIFKIEQLRVIRDAMILTLVDRNEKVYNVWALDRLCKALNKTKGCSSPIYLRSKGIKESKDDTGRWYYDYDMIHGDC